jgi:hypothetical protein
MLPTAGPRGPSAERGQARNHAANDAIVDAAVSRAKFPPPWRHIKITLKFSN